MASGILSTATLNTFIGLPMSIVLGALFLTEANIIGGGYGTHQEVPKETHESHKIS